MSLSLKDFINISPIVGGLSDNINVWVSESYENNVTSSYLRGLTIPEKSTSNGFIEPQLAESTEFVLQFYFGGTPDTQSLSFQGIITSPTPTPTVTPTNTPTVTPTSSPGPVSPTPTPPVISPSVTPTITPTTTVTPSVTPSPSGPAPTPSKTPTLTPTPTVSPTASPILYRYDAAGGTGTSGAACSASTIDYLMYGNNDTFASSTKFYIGATYGSGPFLGGNLWYKEDGGSTALQVDNNGDVLDSAACVFPSPSPDCNLDFAATLGGPSPTPTPTPSNPASPTPTPTPTPTVSVTPTADCNLNFSATLGGPP